MDDPRNDRGTGRPGRPRQPRQIDARYEGPVRRTPAERRPSERAPSERIPPGRGRPPGNRAAPGGWTTPGNRTAAGRPPASRDRRPPPPRVRRRPPPPPRRSRRGAKIAVGLVSLLVMSLTGYAWAAMQGLVSGLTTTDVIDANQPADGARDILLVGMDSRTDAQGNPLPEDLLAELRAGVADGEENTDTLIMVHIPNDGSKAVAISLPRDSYVTIPGFGTHKINSAYARAKAAERKKLQDDGESDARTIEVRSNQAGAKTLIQTVEQLTGSTIDNYASINLLGFSEITKAIGGVDVCLKDDVNDTYSGARFTKGQHTISGVEALEFVRQRHGLPRGDLDRVVRQQVFMAGMARKVLSAGTLADPGKLSGLTDAIKKSVVLNQGWDILGFAQQMKGLTGGQLEFRTIPVVDPDYSTPEDGKAVKVDPSEIRDFVQGVTTPAAPPADAGPAKSATTVDVRNGTGRSGLASSVLQNLTGQGFTGGETSNTTSRKSTVVRYPAGGQAGAQQVADALGSGATVEADPTVSEGHVVVLVGSDFSTEPSRVVQQAAAAPTTQAPAATDDEPITADGITCVN
ncbi:LCP family protein [Amycolatopsis endophytica]|uniref:LCP family protein required for cell wall assembly n=1 Tax=Amycolatopsis endophytica TaxID=860233 RepID=A0A853B5A4_9PSEU|nr:LCP family protein [Amycolatopsis endophytica]NYI89756.1 LCP family protein required for cell wall assembly [Amycolatopsis endophytica]